MSKRNNRKTKKQEITQEHLHAMTNEWCADNEDGRAVVFFSLSENGTVSANVLGMRCNLNKLLIVEALPALLRLYGAPPMPTVEQPRPSLWQRVRDWFFPFFQNLTVGHGAQSEKHSARV